MVCNTTPFPPCWRYITKEYFIVPIVGSSRRGWVTLSAVSQEIDCKPKIVHCAAVIQFPTFSYLLINYYLM